MAMHNDLSLCEHCRTTIRYEEYTQWNGMEHDVLDSWWAHLDQQEDHNAEPIDSNLVSHAVMELARAGYGPEVTDPLDVGIRDQILKMVVIFATDEPGHSGGSAWATIGMLERLLSYKPLTKLTDDPQEWIDVSDFTGPGPTGVWQNRRDGRMFSEDGGKTYYSVDELRTGWRRRLFGRKGKIYTSEPANG